LGSWFGTQFLLPGDSNESKEEEEEEETARDEAAPALTSKLKPPELNPSILKPNLQAPPDPAASE